MAKPKTEFALNQKVVYPSQGVGKITEIFKRDFKGEQVYFYKIYLEVSDMIVMVPAEKAASLGIRAIVSAKEAQEALDLISEEFETPTSDWKLRYQMNLDLLKKGTVKDIASIVRCLYHRSKVKELPILERKLYDNAKKLLEDEISDAMKISVKEVEDMLHAKLEPLGAKIEKKPVYSDDDEDDEDEFAEENNNSRDSDDDDDDEDD
ncbi:CarD family transcriptional regulator [Treponema sp.]|uniref:CarD family transcriptional regulator n=1 Tax=Treponema sp. TaxID=166 RepID=UPI0025EDC1CC|nr:CarD family transcriptional regulator [Treponema sp.]MCR5217139.1 CarD family transcriptional regulator [Treponema sp.]